MALMYPSNLPQHRSAPQRMPVLIVDDMPDNLFLLREYLSEIAHIEVYEATSGEQALTLASEYCFGLIILDVQMPGISGFEVANELQANKNRAPIIFLTAFGNKIEHQLMGYELGAVDYLTKPFNPDILLRKVTVFQELYISRQNTVNLKRYYKETLDHAFEGIIRTDLKGHIHYINEKALTLLGVSVEVVIGESLQCCFPEVESLGGGCGYKEGLMEVVRLSDRSIELDASLVLEISCSNIVHQGCYQGSVLMIQDVSERHRYQQQLMRATQKDGMTGLFNRDFFSVYLAKALHQVRRQDRSIAVLIIDLNDFKLVNDTMGHNAGDELIREVSLRLQRSIRCSDIVARLGGDEFAVAIEESKENMPYASMHVANTIHQQFSKEIQLKGKPFSLSSAIGVAIYPDHGDNLVDLFEAADMAMYRSKLRGLPVEFYNAQMREALEEHNHVRQTLKSDDLSQVLSVAYQPILFFDGDGLEGQWAVEALARWKAPGYAPNPHTFIDIAEKSGSILSLTQCIVEQVNHDLKRLSERGALNYISLNLSPLLLHQPSIFNELLEAIQSSGFAQDGYPRLCLEITESNPLDFNDQLNQQFLQLVDSGWKLAIDDFGAGHSSVSYFESLPFSIVKLDRCLTQGVTKGSKRFRILSGITELAHDVGLSVVAEGVEDALTLETVLAAGCDAVQGFYFSKPMTIDQLLAYKMPFKKG